ncbi:MAG: DNA primase [Deltaproteobacteria bacterium]|nr:DNA primase [Deltaproteobacteria bacterium]
MSLIPEEVTREIRDRTNIVDLIGRYVTLKKAGANHKGLCPFHNEKSPSFNVNSDRQIFHCFGCGEGGDVIGFLMRHENLSFPEAARSLAGELGIEIPENNQASRGESTDELFRANEIALNLFRGALRSSSAAAAREYLKNRGFDGALADRFEMGFAPDSWDSLVKALDKAKISPAQGVRAGLLVERNGGGHYDRFRGRLMFPIRDVRGRVVGFGGRALGADQEPKYLNTAETPVFHKSSLFYGFPAALEPMRRSERGVVVEGYFDQIAMCRAGIDESVATCGTALTESHASNLRRRTRTVVLLFDGDEPGQKAMEKALTLLLPQGLRVRAVLLPEGDDPDTYLQREGVEALKSLVDAAPPALELIMQRMIGKGCSTPWQKTDAVNAVVPFLARVSDGVERANYIHRLALMADTPEGGVARAVRAAEQGKAWDGAEAMPTNPEKETVEARRCRELARLLLDAPEHISVYLTPGTLDLIPGGFWNRFFQAMFNLESQGERIDAQTLSDTLQAEDGKQVLAFLIDRAPELDGAQVVGQIEANLKWLKGRHSKAMRRVVTARVLANPEPDADLLAEKQRQLEERRKAQGV